MSTAAPNAATIAVPAMSCRRDPNVSGRLLGSGGWKASSSPIGARGGAAQSSAGGPSLSSAKLSLLGRTSVRSTVAMLPPIFHPRFPLCRTEGGPAPKSKPSSICRKDGDRKTAERHSNGLLLASFLNFGEWPRQRADSNIRTPCGICSWKCRIGIGIDSASPSAVINSTMYPVLAGHRSPYPVRTRRLSSITPAATRKLVGAGGRSGRIHRLEVELGVAEQR